MNVYPIGNDIVLLATWTVNGIPTDPTAVVFNTKSPDGTVVVYTYPASTEIVKQSVGNYTCRVPAAVRGIWTWGAVGTGPGKAAKQRLFKIVASAFP